MWLWRGCVEAWAGVQRELVAQEALGASFVRSLLGLTVVCSRCVVMVCPVPARRHTVGTCLNRWFDKTLQIIVCSNGSAGIVFEHSMVDGHTVLRFASDVYTDTILCVARTSLVQGGGALGCCSWFVPHLWRRRAVLRLYEQVLRPDHQAQRWVVHAEHPCLPRQQHRYARHTPAPHRDDPPTPVLICARLSVTDATPRKIHWQLNDDLYHSIRKAESQYSDLIARVCSTHARGSPASSLAW